MKSARPFSSSPLDVIIKYGLPPALACPCCGSSVPAESMEDDYNYGAFASFRVRYKCPCDVALITEVSTRASALGNKVSAMTRVYVLAGVLSRLPRSGISRSLSDEVAGLRRRVPFTYKDLHMAAAVLKAEPFVVLENLCRKAQKQGLPEVLPLAIDMAALIQRLEEAR